VAGRYGALQGNALASATDPQLYQFALNYAQAHAMGTPQGVGPGVAGGLPSFGAPVRLELGGGQTNARTALERRKILALSLAHRTTESSRRRAEQRLLSGYGLGLGPVA
jgi:hypothetical protein